MGYWEEQQMKQMGYFEEEQKTVPDPKFGEPALEKTLENVKKTLWDVERHTSNTQSRLDKNNQSGPSHPLYKIAKWTANDWALDIITETLVEIQDTLENSSIARHSKSPLETSLDSIKEATVSFNEKTMRWHDVQTNLMVKGSDPRVQAAKLKSKPSDEMVTKKKTGIGVLAGFLKEIAESNSLIAKALAGTAEDKLEGKVANAKAAKEEKKQTGMLSGMWETMKKSAAGSWLLDNWKMIAATLFVLFAPLKWIKKLWGWAKTFWDMPIWGKLLTALGLIATYTLAKTVAGKAMDAVVSGGSRALGAARAVPGTVLQKATAAGHMTPAQKAMSAQRAAAKKAVPTKGIFGKIVEKFGKAGKWIKQLGSKFIMPLITTPAGWAILTGLAIGGLVYAYWDEIKAGLSKAFGFLTTAVDSLKKKLQSISIIGMIRSFIGVLPKMLQSPLLSIFGEGKKDKPKTPEEISDEAETRKTTGKMKKGEWLMQEKKKWAEETGRPAEEFGQAHGGAKGIKKLRKAYLAGGGTTAPTDAPTEKLNAAMQRSSTRSLATYREKGNKRGGKRKMEMELQSPTGQLTWDAMTEKEQKRFKLYNPSKKRGGGEDKHKAVKVSGADMSGVSWNKLGGKDTIEDAILTTWNQQGVSGTPTFTSGLRKKDAKESLANPRSQHIQGTAFDLRSKDLGSKGPAVFADIKEKFAGMGLWGQWEKGDTNAKNRTGEHFHFQLAAKGFGGIVNKATGFIAGEEGPEMVNIIPLQSPNDKMNVMNAINAENQTLQGQSGSPTIINTTNAQATTTNQTGGVFTLPNPVAAPKLTTSLPS